MSQLEIALLSPIRYRRYYYDNETGYYYLQSRYYDPELGRFISADSFEYLDTSNVFNAIAYVYCWNCPVIFDDEQGTTPQISINPASIQAFFAKTEQKISDAFYKGLERLQEHIDKIKCRFDEFAEKAKFYINNPQEFFVDTLSILFKRDVGEDLKNIKNNIRNLIFGAPFSFEIINTPIYAGNSSYISATQLDENGISNAWMAIIQALISGIELFSFNNLLVAISNIIGEDVSLDAIMRKSITENWYDTFYNLCCAGLASWNVFWDFIFGYLDTSSSLDIMSIAKKAFGEGIKDYVNIWGVIGSVIQLIDGVENPYYFSSTENMVLNIVNLVFNLVSVFLLPFGADIIIPKIADMITKVIILLSNNMIVLVK